MTTNEAKKDARYWAGDRDVVYQHLTDPSNNGKTKAESRALLVSKGVHKRVIDELMGKENSSESTGLSTAMTSRTDRPTYVADHARSSSEARATPENTLNAAQFPSAISDWQICDYRYLIYRLGDYEGEKWIDG